MTYNYTYHVTGPKQGTYTKYYHNKTPKMQESYSSKSKYYQGALDFMKSLRSEPYQYQKASTNPKNSTHSTHDQAKGKSCWY